MIEPTVRMYASEETARAAAADLVAAGLPVSKVFVVTPGAGGSDDGTDSIAAAIMAGHVLRSHARVYADGIRAGRSLVIARAPFGFGQIAINLMESHGPVDSGLVLPAEPAPTWDEAAPLSSALQFPPLLRKRPAPLSDLLGLPALLPAATDRSSRMLPALTAAGWSLSSVLGFGLLSRAAAPLSSLLGLRLLSGTAAPLSKRLGLKVLSGGGGRWTRSFGLPLLSSNPTPLSSLLGLRTIIPHD